MIELRVESVEFRVETQNFASLFRLKESTTTNISITKNQNNMKKSLPIALAFVLFALIGNTALAQTFDYPVKGKQGFALTEKTRSGLHITYNVGQVSINAINYRCE